MKVSLQMVCAPALADGRTDWVADENFHPDDTDTSADYEKHQFLDLRKPLLRQVWNANWRCVRPVGLLYCGIELVPQQELLLAAGSPAPALD
jgi:hypothetical protein